MDHYVRSLLTLNGLKAYVEIFRENLIDKSVFKFLDESSLQELIPPIGLRIKCKMLIKKASEQDHDVIANDSETVLSVQGSSHVDSPTTVEPPVEAKKRKLKKNAVIKTKYPQRDMEKLKKFTANLLQNSSDYTSEMLDVNSITPEILHLEMGRNLRDLVLLQKLKEASTKPVDTIFSATDINRLNKTCSEWLCKATGGYPSSNQKLALAKTILDAFPCLKSTKYGCLDFWFSKSSHRQPARGIIHFKINNFRRRLITEERKFAKSKSSFLSLFDTSLDVENSLTGNTDFENSFRELTDSGHSKMRSRLQETPLISENHKNFSAKLQELTFSTGKRDDDSFKNSSKRCRESDCPEKLYSKHQDISSRDTDLKILNSKCQDRTSSIEMNHVEKDFGNSFRNRHKSNLPRRLSLTLPHTSFSGKGVNDFIYTSRDCQILDQPKKRFSSRSQETTSSILNEKADFQKRFSLRLQEIKSPPEENLIIINSKEIDRNFDDSVSRCSDSSSHKFYFHYNYAFKSDAENMSEALNKCPNLTSIDIQQILKLQSDTIKQQAQYFKNTLNVILQSDNNNLNFNSLFKDFDDFGNSMNPFMKIKF